ncbi:MAG: hypothetical protein JNJ78_17755 [Anaerolineae bacterium]|nr:hypothetical protein [Anaerolineae bacterium]
MAAGNTVMAAAMPPRQREAGGQPPTKNRRMREDGELPQTNAATSAKRGEELKRGRRVEGMVNLG